MATLWTVKAHVGMAIFDFGTDDYDEAREKALRKVGSNYFRSIDEATDEDIRWVHGMGGRLPLAAKQRLSLGEA